MDYVVDLISERVYGRQIDMAETIALEVARYRPEQGTEPAFQTFDVPFRHASCTVSLEYEEEEEHAFTDVE